MPNLAAPHLRDGQVVFLPPGTFGSYIFARAAKDAGNRAEIATAETGTLPWLARKQGPYAVRISGRGARLPTGVFPLRLAPHALGVIERAFPNAIEPCGDALSGALMNAGPIIHPPLITMNAGPIEHFDKWDIHKEGTQPAIRRVTDALDAERIAIREALGYGGPHFPLADHYSKDGEPWMYARDAHDQLTDSGDWSERLILVEHRYMLEDLRLGLSFLASVAGLAGVQTPLVKAFLAIGSAITGQDFAVTGRSLGFARPRRSRPGRIAKSSRRGFSMKPVIGCLGAGRMGRGIAVVFAFAGHQVVVVDFKEREASAFEALAAEAKAEIRSTLEILSRIDLLPAELVPTIAERITIVPRQEASCGAAALRCHLRRNAGNPRLEAGGAGRGLAAGGRRPDHRLDHVDDTGRRSRGIDRTPRPLPQCALAQSGLSGAADRIVSGAAHRAGSDGADEGAARRHRQGAGRLRGAAGLHRSAESRRWR